MFSSDFSLSFSFSVPYPATPPMAAPVAARTALPSGVIPAAPYDCRMENTPPVAGPYNVDWAAAARDPLVTPIVPKPRDM